MTEDYKCAVCGLTYTNSAMALSCEQAHDVIYVAFKRSDLFNLVNFLYTKDSTLLTESLVKTLMQYRKGSYK
jgi:hypothetical protein